MKVSKQKIYLFFIGVLLVYSIFITAKLSNPNHAKFSLVSPEIASLSVDEFLERQKSLTISYHPVRSKIEGIIDGSNGHYGVYFEDLTSGAWIGINERENSFVPASLLKLPTMVAVMKKIELGELKMEDKVKIDKSNLDSRSGNLWKNGEGYEISIEELLNYLVKGSDNTAMNVLNRQVLSIEELVEAQYAMGLPAPEEINDQKMSPKGYSNLLRSLYLSSYLRRTFSEKCLSLMIDTEFNEGIPSTLPDDIKVAHKVGFSQDGNYNHDCGIVYHPNKPYILCIMSLNTSKSESNKVFGEISWEIYNYVDKN